jgi:hypothetical protein
MTIIIMNTFFRGKRNKTINIINPTQTPKTPIATPRVIPKNISYLSRENQNIPVACREGSHLAFQSLALWKKISKTKHWDKCTLKTSTGTFV